MLRQSQWFRNMGAAVRAFVESCKCQTANLANPTSSMKLKPLPQSPWKITAVDYKGPIGARRNKVYLHTQMDAYSHYPVVHLLNSTKLTELKKLWGSPSGHMVTWSKSGATGDHHTTQTSVKDGYRSGESSLRRRRPTNHQLMGWSNGSTATENSSSTPHT